MSNRVRISSSNILRLAAEAGRHPQTVQEVLAGRGQRTSRSAVFEAAKRLGIDLPASAGTAEDPPTPATAAADDPQPLRVRAT